MSVIGQRLREEVEKLGGVAPAARIVGKERNTIYNWIEKGNVPANELMLLAAAGADVQYILTGIRSGQATGTHGGSYSAPSIPPSQVNEGRHPPPPRWLNQLGKKLKKWMAEPNRANRTLALTFAGSILKERDIHATEEQMHLLDALLIEKADALPEGIKVSKALVSAWLDEVMVLGED